MPHLKASKINKIVSKIETKNEGIIYWDEFLKFLEDEGEMREIINEMRIHQPGVTKLV
jgi:hypothetical protein